MSFSVGSGLPETELQSSSSSPSPENARRGSMTSSSPNVVLISIILCHMPLDVPKEASIVDWFFPRRSTLSSPSFISRRDSSRPIPRLRNVVMNSIVLLPSVNLVNPPMNSFALPPLPPRKCAISSKLPRSYGSRLKSGTLRPLTVMSDSALTIARNDVFPVLFSPTSKVKGANCAV